ncbi:MAG: translation initiation factor IF-2 [Candidatus Methylomirabilales bacterium]
MIRIYQLAKELGLSSKELLSRLNEAGLAVKSHSSNVDEAQARAILASPPRIQEEPEVKKPKETAKAEVLPKPKPRPRPKAGPPPEAVQVEPPPVEIPPAALAEPEIPIVETPKAVPPLEAPSVEAKPFVEVPPKPAIKLAEAITVKELAERLGQSVSDLIKRLMKLGVMATINQSVSPEVAKQVAAQFGIEIELLPIEELVEAPPEVEDPTLLRPRAPVVTIMGHVDHGKTSLLDAIRRTNVTALEVGGITQHIGAYEVELEGGKVVFLDTPGHEAFTAMRARGAQVTDVVVLVVAADDGVMPQTIEAINHAKAAGVPILVAINKIDKPHADPNRVRQQLADLGLVPEEWGGQTIFVEVSAKKRIGIENLLEMLLLLAELQELKANPFRPAKGTVIEAKLDRGRGPVATVLVQQGTLRVGDAFVAGLQYGKVRALINDKGRKLQEAGPATPVEVLGFSGVPMAGDQFVVVSDERKARQIALTRQQKHREVTYTSKVHLTLEDLHRRIREGEVKELRLIIKGDVQGSIEALREALERLGGEAVKLKVIHAALGPISESDVMLASASNAIILGFGVRADPQAHRLAEQERVQIRLYNVIYDAIAEVKAAMEGLLEPKYVERVIGRVEVRQLFQIPKVGTVAGCYVLEGKVARDASVRLLRDGRVVHEGRVASLRRFKEDVKEVSSGYECGVALQNFNDIKVGDIIEAYELEAIAQKL